MGARLAAAQAGRRRLHQCGKASQATTGQLRLAGAGCSRCPAAVLFCVTFCVRCPAAIISKCTEHVNVFLPLRSSSLQLVKAELGAEIAFVQLADILAGRACMVLSSVQRGSLTESGACCAWLSTQYISGL